jgi:hypothetical protein
MFKHIISYKERYKMARRFIRLMFRELDQTEKFIKLCRDFGQPKKKEKEND